MTIATKFDIGDKAFWYDEEYGRLARGKVIGVRAAVTEEGSATCYVILCPGESYTKDESLVSASAAELAAVLRAKEAHYREAAKFMEGYKHDETPT